MIEMEFTDSKAFREMENRALPTEAYVDASLQMDSQIDQSLASTTSFSSSSDGGSLTTDIKPQIREQFDRK